MHKHTFHNVLWTCAQRVSQIPELAEPIYKLVTSTDIGFCKPAISQAILVLAETFGCDLQLLA